MASSSAGPMAEHPANPRRRQMFPGGGGDELRQASCPSFMTRIGLAPRLGHDAGPVVLQRRDPSRTLDRGDATLPGDGANHGAGDRGETILVLRDVTEQASASRPRDVHRRPVPRAADTGHDESMVVRASWRATTTGSMTRPARRSDRRRGGGRAAQAAGRGRRGDEPLRMRPMPTSGASPCSSNGSSRRSWPRRRSAGRASRSRSLWSRPCPR
jgi:hypothetical protein